MPDFDIIKEFTPSVESYRVATVRGVFDLQAEKIKEQFKGGIDIEGKQWNIGVIFGRSGSGKSTIARELFPANYIRGFEYNAQSVLDDMPADSSIKDIFKIFNSVGFSSPPSWLKNYDVLSTGEKMRVDIARAILEQRDMIVFDEFTSVIDREVARIGSIVISKTIRKMEKSLLP